MKAHIIAWAAALALILTLQIGKAEDQQWEGNGYVVTADSTAPFGTPSHKYHVKITKDGNIIWEKRSTSYINSFAVIPASVQIDSEGLWIAYKQLVDGLDDTSVFLLRFVGNIRIESKAVIGRQTGDNILNTCSVAAAAGPEAPTRMRDAILAAYPDIKVPQE